MRDHPIQHASDGSISIADSVLVKVSESEEDTDKDILVSWSLQVTECPCIFQHKSSCLACKHVAPTLYDTKSPHWTYVLKCPWWYQAIDVSYGIYGICSCCICQVNRAVYLIRMFLCLFFTRYISIGASLTKIGYLDQTWYKIAFCNDFNFWSIYMYFCAVSSLILNDRRNNLQGPILHNPHK